MHGKNENEESAKVVALWKNLDRRQSLGHHRRNGRRRHRRRRRRRHGRGSCTNNMIISCNMRSSCLLSTMMAEYFLIQLKKCMGRNTKGYFIDNNSMVIGEVDYIRQRRRSIQAPWVANNRLIFINKNIMMKYWYHFRPKISASWLWALRRASDWAQAPASGRNGIRKDYII